MIEPWALRLTQELALYDDAGADRSELSLRLSWALTADALLGTLVECARTPLPSWSSPS